MPSKPVLSDADKKAIRKKLEELCEECWMLKQQPYPDTQTLCQLDLEFTEQNLSPGGSADLLAVCYLLYFLENEV